MAEVHQGGGHGEIHGKPLPTAALPPMTQHPSNPPPNEEEVCYGQSEDRLKAGVESSQGERGMLRSLIHVKQEGKVIEYSRTYMHGVVDGGGLLLAHRRLQPRLPQDVHGAHA